MSMWNFLINSMCDDNRNKKKLSAKICSEFHYRCFHFSSAFTQILPCCCCTVELIFFWFLLMFFYMQECRKWWICLKGVHSGIKQHSLNWECIQWQKNVGQQPRKNLPPRWWTTIWLFDERVGQCKCSSDNRDLLAKSSHACSQCKRKNARSLSPGQKFCWHLFLHDPVLQCRCALRTDPPVVCAGFAI